MMVVPQSGMADRHPQNRVVLAITASASSQLLCRLVGLFAQQDRLIDRLTVDRAGEEMHVTIAVSDLDDCRAEIIANKMRGLVEVGSVILSVR